MKTAYFIWKDPSCNGINPEWQEITGKAFLALVRSPEAMGRRFVRLEDTTDGTGGAIVMEATEAVYLDWKREKNHTDYLRSVANGTSIASYHALENESGTYGEDRLLNADCDVEADFMRLHDTELLREALTLLTAAERQMMDYLYLSDSPGTVRGYEDMTGISKSTVNRRQLAVLAKLKKFLEN